MSGPFGFDDAARRVSDACRQAIVDGYRGQWMAFALEDGTTDGTRYLTRSDVVRHHGNKARMFMYVRIPWDDVTERAAAVYLRAHRQLAELGQHMVDDELPDTAWMFDNRREAHPGDPRRVLHPDAARQNGRSRLILPRGYR